MSNFYVEDILLQGYINVHTQYWTDQHIPTQGYYGYSVPASSIPLFINDVISSSDYTKITQYFPRWMECHYSTDLSTGSLLNRLFFYLENENVLLNMYIKSHKDKLLWDFIKTEIDKGWTCDSTIKGKDIRTVAVRSANTTSYPRRCISAHDFSISIAPAYIIEEQTNCIYFRNLDHNIATLSITGTITLGENEIIEGTEIYWTDDTTSYDHWYLLESNSSMINYNTGTITLGVTGSIAIIYKSYTYRQFYESATVLINGIESVNLSSLDYWNNFDDMGLIFDIPRFRGEINQNYYNRLSCSFPLQNYGNSDGVSRSIALKLNCLDKIYWNTLNPITFSASSRITGFKVSNEKPYYYISEYLSDKINYVTHSPSGLSYLIKDGKVYRNYTYVNGCIDLNNSPGNYEFTYKYLPYTSSSSGIFLTSITPVSISPSRQIALLTRGILSRGLSNKTYIRTLINAQGTPSSELLNLASNISERSKNQIGYRRWGRDAWLEGNIVSLDYISEGLD